MSRKGQVHPEVLYKMDQVPDSPATSPKPCPPKLPAPPLEPVAPTSASFCIPGRCTINPLSEGMGQWDKIIMAVLLYTALVTPFEVSFLTPSFGVMFYLNRLVDCIFLVDIVFTFLLDPGNDQSLKDNNMPSHKKIAINYLTGWFAIDVVSCLPFDAFSILMEGTSVEDIKFLRTLRLFRLIKLVRLLRATRMFDRWEDSMAINFALLSLAKSCTMVFLFSHWFACLWYITYDIEESPENWVVAGGFQHYNVLESYIAAWYFAVMTMSTIGYGDITPVTSTERVVACCMMLVGAGIYAYVVGSITSTVQSMEAATRKYQELMDQLNKFLEENNVERDLRVQARRYFRTRHQAGNLVDWRGLLNEMSPDLREAIAAQSHSHWIGDSSFFWQAPDDFVGKAAALFQEVTYPKGERILEIGQPVDFLYVIKRGVVWSRGKVHMKGSMFGEDVVLNSKYNPERRSTYVSMALTFVQLQALDWEELYALLDEFPQVKAQTERTCLRYLFKEHLYAYASAYRGSDTKPLGFPNYALIQHYEWKLKWLRVGSCKGTSFFRAVVRIQSAFRGHQGRLRVQLLRNSLIHQVDRRISRSVRDLTRVISSVGVSSHPGTPDILKELVDSMLVIGQRLDSIDKKINKSANVRVSTISQTPGAIAAPPPLPGKPQATLDSNLLH